MPSIILKTEGDFKFLFRVAFVLLFLHFTLGRIDFVFSGMSFDLLARHFHDGVFVGQRFHGLVGEPRDAASLILSLFLFLGIYSYYKTAKVKAVRGSIIIILVVSWGATFSFSGLLAILFAFILYGVYCANFLSIKNTSKLFLFALILAAFGTMFLYHSERLFNYFDAYFGMMSGLIANPFLELLDLIRSSYNNVFPMIMMVKDVISGNLFPLLFGYGLGSSGRINSILYSEFLNPNSQIIRLIYEFGVCGNLLFVWSIFSTVRSAAKKFSLLEKRRIELFLVIAIGAVFAHRGYLIFMWVGLLVSVSSYKIRQSNIGLFTN